MNSTKLYIIGNGFDLHHNLKTSYAHFCQYVKKNNIELFNFLEYYLNIDLDNNGLWKDFEKSLGTFDNKAFHRDYDNSEPSSDEFRLSDIFGVIDELTERSSLMIEEMREALYDWINEIDYYDKKYKELPLEFDAKYLIFNYTSTLEKLYNISEKNILHIHNYVTNDINNLIFGHDRIIESSPMLDNEGNSNYPTSSFLETEGASKMLLTQFYKDTNKIINENEAFFLSLKYIKEIIVLGHSLNDIDLPYFKHIIKIVGNDIKWKISYHYDTEYEEMKEKMKSFGVISEVTFIKMECLI